MSTTLCTFPGKLGDLLWALPTMRELARTTASGKVDLLTSAYCEPLVELLRVGCPYLGAVVADPLWTLEFTAPVSPRMPPTTDLAGLGGNYARTIHLGYESWPVSPLLEEILRIGQVFTQFWADSHTKLAAVMSTPWITTEPAIGPNPRRIYLGWTDEWFELKLGLTHLLTRNLHTCFYHTRFPNNRWATEAYFKRGGIYRWATEAYFKRGDICALEGGWLDTARLLASCPLYVGDLSAQWVLANALGIPCVVVEPSEARHNPIFWWDGPVELDGKPRNVMVRGGDGKPTFDARAVVSAVEGALERQERLWKMREEAGR